MTSSIDFTLVADKAYMQLMTAKALLETLNKENHYIKGKTFAEQYNALYKEVVEIFKTDQKFSNAIGHIKPLEYKEWVNNMDIRMNNGREVLNSCGTLLPEIIAKLTTFIALHMPDPQKKKIGF